MPVESRETSAQGAEIALSTQSQPGAPKRPPRVRLVAISGALAAAVVVAQIDRAPGPAPDGAADPGARVDLCGALQSSERTGEALLELARQVTESDRCYDFARLLLEGTEEEPAADTGVLATLEEVIFQDPGVAVIEVLDEGAGEDTAPAADTGAREAVFEGIEDLQALIQARAWAEIQRAAEQKMAETFASDVAGFSQAEAVAVAATWVVICSQRLSAVDVGADPYAATLIISDCMEYADQVPGMMPYEQQNLIGRAATQLGEVAELILEEGDAERYPLARTALERASHWEGRGGGEDFYAEPLQRLEQLARKQLRQASRGSVGEREAALRELLEWAPVGGEAWTAARQMLGSAPEVVAGGGR